MNSLGNGDNRFWRMSDEVPILSLALGTLKGMLNVEPYRHSRKT